MAKEIKKELELLKKQMRELEKEIEESSHVRKIKFNNLTTGCNTKDPKRVSYIG